MEICPYVTNRCCTISDEIKIIKFFKEGTMPILSDHYDKYYSTVAKIMMVFNTFKLLDPMQMNLRFKSRREVPYN